MKFYEKEKVLIQSALFSIMQEIEFYKKFNKSSLFICELKFAFQDKDNFYIVQEFVEGGDLRYIMNNRILTQNEIKFIAANLILLIDFLHSNGYAYRDLKPENILIDSKGYVKISDFKLMREISTVNFHDMSGTHGYIAPEIILNLNHGCASDIFSIGIILYELMMGYLPYKSTSRKEYKKDIIKEMVLIKNSDLPENWDQIPADFINRCIYRRPITRIGYNSIEEIKDHKWFEDIDWIFLKQRTLKANYLPNNGKNYLPREKVFKFYNELNSNQIKKIFNIIEDFEIQGYFKGYYYDELYAKFLEDTEKKHLGEKEFIEAIDDLIEDEIRDKNIIINYNDDDENSDDKSLSKSININNLNESSNQNLLQNNSMDIERKSNKNLTRKMIK